MKTMYEFTVTATASEVRLTNEVHDLDLAIKLFHEHAESKLFDQVELKDNCTGEVHAHTNGKDDDYCLSGDLIDYMAIEMMKMMFGEVPTPPPTSEEPPQVDPLEAILRAIVEQGGLPD